MCSGSKRWAGIGLVVMVALLDAACVLAAPGDVDTGAGRIPTLPLVRPDGSLYEIEPDALIHWNARATGAPLGRYPFSSVPLEPGWHFYDPALLLANGDLLIPVTGSRSGGPRAEISHLVRLQPDGRRAGSFGVDGIVPLDDADDAAPKPDRRIVAGLQELADGRILVLEADWSCGLPRANQNYGPGFFDWETGETDWICGAVPRSMLRLLPDGRIDTSFGVGGRAAVSGGRRLFLARADGSVLLDGAGRQLQLISPTGAVSILMETVDVSGAVLSRDGSLFIVSGAPTGSKFALRLVQVDADRPSEARVSDIVLAPAGSSAGDWFQVGSAVLDQTEENLYVLADFWNKGSQHGACAGVVRVSLLPQPALDPAFGSDGYACLVHQGSDTWGSRLQWQPGGGLLLSSYVYGFSSVLNLRLHTNSSTGAGILSPSQPWEQVDEGDRNVNFVVYRTGGSAGEVRLQWATEPGGSAIANQDYVASSGTLTWPDGDTSPRVISVPILDDSVRDSGPEIFSIRLSVPADSTPALLFADTLRANILDNEPPPATVYAVPPSPDRSNESGGGALGIGSLFGLLGLLGVPMGAAVVRGRRHNR